MHNLNPVSGKIPHIESQDTTHPVNVHQLDQPRIMHLNSHHAMTCNQNVSILQMPAANQEEALKDARFYPHRPALLPTSDPARSCPLAG
jgi:hypothetical protein